MALPTLVNTWAFSVNNIINEVAAADCHKRVFLNLFEALLANGFTVAGSCDATTAGIDGVNRITTLAKIVCNSGTAAHSWIVLAAPDGVQHLWEFNSTANSNIRYLISNAVGFTGGSTTTRPTASDEYLLADNTSYVNSMSTATAWDGVHHIGIVPATGEFWSILLVGGVTKGIMFYRKVSSAPAAWAKPGIAHGGYTALTWAAFSGNPACKGGPLFTLHITGESYSNVPIPSIAVINEVTQEWPFVPMGVYSPTTGYRGRLGKIDDWFWGASTATLVMGTTYPADTTRQFIQFDQFIMPWNGSIPVVA